MYSQSKTSLIHKRAQIVLNWDRVLTHWPRRKDTVNCAGNLMAHGHNKGLNRGPEWWVVTISTPESSLSTAYKKNNFPQDQEGYDTTEPRPCMESSCQGTSTGAGIHFVFSFFGKLILKNRWKCPTKNVSLHSWIRLVESSNTEVSGVSVVPQSRGKVFRKPSCCDRNTY